MACIFHFFSYIIKIIEKGNRRKSMKLSMMFTYMERGQRINHGPCGWTQWKWVEEFGDYIKVTSQITK